YIYGLIDLYSFFYVHLYIEKSEHLYDFLHRSSTLELPRDFLLFILVFNLYRNRIPAFNLLGNFLCSRLLEIKVPVFPSYGAKRILKLTNRRFGLSSNSYQLIRRV